MTVRFETTPNGEIAILPRAEYERLKRLADEGMEDAGTARLVARARKEVAAGAPLLPKGVVDRLANGENPIRVLREFRNETQTELRVRIGITQGYLSDLENGKRKGPLELHQKIARALGVPLDLLAPVGVSQEEADPVRFAHRKRAIKDTVRRRRR
ncbi:MAG TPA: helix-turn-helix transcriptional regulator [Xanthobacteraceae bacterium]|nr:helix-turn-helix transcriptional regulator [Xanthobacteraceae bacterium]